MFLILYLFPKACFKFQKLQTLIILLYAFQLGTIGCTLFVVSGMIENSIDLRIRVRRSISIRWSYCSYCEQQIDTFKQRAKVHLVVGTNKIRFLSKVKGTCYTRCCNLCVNSSCFDL